MKFEIDMLDVGNANSFLVRYFGDDEKEKVILVEAGKSKHGSIPTFVAYRLGILGCLSRQI